MVLKDADSPRFLVIGTGSIGRRHVANLKGLVPGGRLAFLRHDARADDFSSMMHAHVFGALDRAIEWRPTMAIVASPSDRHFDTLPGLLAAGIPTFIEKPVVIRAEDCAYLAGLRRVDLPPTQVGCVLRFTDLVVRLKSWLDEGQLGRLIRARFECGQYLPDWRPGSDYRTSYSASRERGGGVIFDLVHEIDLAVMFFGDCTLLHAVRDQRSSLQITSEDVALLHLRAADGLPIEVALDYVSRRPRREIRVVGEEATAILDFRTATLALHSPSGEEQRVVGTVSADAAYRLELAELLDAAHGRGMTRLPLHEGLKATRLAIAAHAFVDQGGDGN